MDKDKPRDLRLTFLPVTSIIALLGGAIVAAWTGSQWKSALDANTSAIADLSAKIGDTWTRTDHDEWAEVLKALNPDMKFPPRRVRPPK